MPCSAGSLVAIVLIAVLRPPRLGCGQLRRRYGAISRRPTPRCSTATANCCSACAPTPRVRRGQWIALADVSPALRTRHAAERRQALLRTQRRRLARRLGRRLGQPVEHAHARRLDHHDAARRPARRRPAARQRRTQPGAEARADGGGARSWSATGARTRSSRPTSTRVPFRGEIVGIDALSRTLFGKAPHGLDAREAAVAAALVRAPNAKPALVAQRACEVLRAMEPAPEGRLRGARHVRQRGAAAAGLRRQRRHRAASGAACCCSAARCRADRERDPHHAARAAAALCARHAAAPPARTARPQRGRRRAAWCSTTPAARCWPGSAPRAS